MKRLVACLLALGVVAAGLRPAAARYRCVRMDAVMARPCCATPATKAPEQTSVGDPCCENLPARAVEKQAAPRTAPPEIDAPQLAGALVYARADLVATFVAVERAVDRPSPGGRPYPVSPVLRL